MHIYTETEIEMMETLMEEETESDADTSMWQCNAHHLAYISAALFTSAPPSPVTESKGHVNTLEELFCISDPQKPVPFFGPT